MMEKVLMKGTEAIGEAAIRAGCRIYCGYPITPQSELLAYLAKKMPHIEGASFLQSESEVAAINMIYGAAGAGARAMTSSSSPGVSLKQEGISYIAGAELPCVIVNASRGGPGLGSIQPAQSDYFQATKGGGHGDYRLIVLAPKSVQEMYDYTFDAFDLADKYRTPVMLMCDGALSQLMEPVVLKDIEVKKYEKPWATTGAKGRKPVLVSSLRIDPADMEKQNDHLFEKYEKIIANEARYESTCNADTEYVVVAYGIMARIAQTAIKKLRQEGIEVGLIRPITLWPFPVQAFDGLRDQAKLFISLELNKGQMVEDVRLAVNGKAPVEFYGRSGGMMPKPDEIVEVIKRKISGVEKCNK
ncbi:MAG: 3-methyl-2-oxobutanoate dehydrogenase subunit VorB [Clostridia bacterium]|nr:3-methyl-2-oxobutanoate dehydrogenase subunit VorB [Clostridia bacterium]